MDYGESKGKGENSEQCFYVPRSLAERGITRRDFMKFCTAMSAALALPMTLVPRIAAARA